VPRILLLLPSTTYRAADFVTAATALGAEVVVASEFRQALSGLMGARALRLNLSRPEAAARAIVEHAADLPLDAVVAVDDQGVLPAALAAAELGVRHNAPDAVLATRDKARMRERLDAGGVPQPRWALLEPDGDPAHTVRQVGLPCVLKPRSLSGSRGVIRVDGAGEAAAVAARIRAIVREAGEDTRTPLLVESFVAGAEVAVEGLLRGGALEILAVFDKPDPLEGPYFEETIYVTPSRAGEPALTAVRGVVAQACAAIGLSEGPVHAEVRLGPAGPVVLEVAARSIGGLCARALRFGAGISLEEVILRHALRLPLDDLTREAAASGVMMLPIPRAGELLGVEGQDRALAVQGIVGLEITVPPGRRVVPLPEGDRYLGFLFARAQRPEDVEAALRTAHGLLDVRIAEQPQPVR
jgi:biotin carboxylase